jgi:putative two-component system response regulator
MEKESIIARTSNIMIVDDQAANLQVLSEILKRDGYKIRPVPNGKLALSAAEHDPPDLILLDIMMPEMDGYEVCKRLKAHASLNHIPVIFISALDDTGDKIKGFHVGGVDYITKPFRAEEVLARVGTHLCLERYTHHLEELVQEKVREIYSSQMATLLAVSKLAESRDDVTGQHIERTREFCRIMAQELHNIPRFANVITETFINTIFHASPMHDIGKVGIADHILLKPGKLTIDEFEIMKKHVLIGATTLQTVLSQYPQNVFIGMGIDLARSHHERWDGNGYPDQLVGNAIPLSARIMAVADVYDALRCKRPYKDAYTHEKTRDIIIEGAGSHFDPDVVTAFIACESSFADICRNMASGLGEV